MRRRIRVGLVVVGLVLLLGAAWLWQKEKSDADYDNSIGNFVGQATGGLQQNKDPNLLPPFLVAVGGVVALVAAYSLRDTPA